MQRFLDDHETSWETDSEVGAELIVEIAGRVCYMSLGDKQFRKTNADYVGNLINQGHGSVLGARRLGLAHHRRLAQPDA